MQELIIIGGGPAGISASLYAARANVRTSIIENGPGSLAKAVQIDNYYGAPMSGSALYSGGLKQAAALGVKIIRSEAVGAEYTGNFIIQTKTSSLEAAALILATGVQSIAPNIPGLRQLEGRGVSYCATCDGFFFRKKKVAVLGSGAYALHEAEYLRHLAHSVLIFTNGAAGADVRAAGWDVEEQPLRALNGSDKLESVTLADGRNIELDGLFIALGAAGSLDFARKLGAETNGRFLKTGPGGVTNIPGLFGAGDCTGGLLQIAKAVYEGAEAANAAVRFLRGKE